MATAIFFHAHPDDEAMLTAGTMAKLAGAGHRVVLVTATRGDHGEVVPGVLTEGESLADRRIEELQQAAAVLGVARLEVLGYVDSGMMGTPENDAPGSFWQADLEQAASRLAQILAEENAAAFVTYDDHGGYGHPDHIQVHRVGLRAAELAGTPVVYEASIDRDRLIALIEMARETGEIPEEEVPDVDTATFGVPSSAVTTRVDVTEQVPLKRKAMAVHASQIPGDSIWMTMPEDRFAAAFGEEVYIRRGAPPGTAERDLDLSAPS
jgi:LmbE family N-acetylglucosaminyl deacetylase